jgi:hypothetical protein
MKLYPALLLSTALVFSACDADTAKKTKAPAQREALMGLGKDSEYRVETPTAFTGVKQVVIGGFKVGFVEQTKTTVQSEDDIGSSTANVALKGVDSQVMQRITDAAYGDFIARLQKRGYKVIERTALIENRDYAKANHKKSPLREEMTLQGDDATVLYFAPRGVEGLYFTGETGRSGGFGFSNPQIAAINFAEENKTPVLFVTYQMGFAAHGNAKGVEHNVTQQIAALPEGGVRMVGGSGGDFTSSNGHIALAQSVTTEASYGEVKGTTSRTSRGLESASNLFSAVLGGGKNQTRTFEVTASPSKYQAAALKVLAKANDKLTAKMQALR